MRLIIHAGIKSYSTLVKGAPAKFMLKLRFSISLDTDLSPSSSPFH